MQYKPLTKQMIEFLPNAKLQAIKHYKDYYDVSLKEAQEAIDYYSDRLESTSNKVSSQIPVSTSSGVVDDLQSHTIQSKTDEKHNIEMVKEELFESINNAFVKLYNISATMVQKNTLFIDILPMTDLEKSGYFGNIAEAKTRSSGYRRLKSEQFAPFMSYLQKAHDVLLIGEEVLYSSVSDLVNTIIGSSYSIEGLKELIRTSGYKNKAPLYLKLAKFYNEEDPEELNEAIESCNEGLKFINSNDKLYWILYNHLKNLTKMKNSLESADIVWLRQTCLEIARKAPKDIVLVDESIIKQAWRDFEYYDSLFIKSLFEKSYLERKAIMPVSQYTSIDAPYLQVVDIKKLPRDLSFPVGHPVVNHVYIGHPYVATKYLPLEDYQLTLIEDKVREYCEIAQSLGAISIDIEALNTYESTSSNGSSLEVAGEIQAGIGVSAEYKHNAHSHLLDSLVNSIALHQKYNPAKEPTIPEDCVWYQNEPSWQRLFKQRMTGGLLVHEERVETKKAQMLDGQELSSIKGAVKGIFSELNLSFNQQDERQYELQENGVLKIEVHFAPIETLGVKSNSASETSNTNLLMSIVSDDEKEYIQEVQYLLEDGEIGPRERKYLERCASRLGISPERALELESSLITISLSDDEKEYLEEVRLTLEDGEIGPRERKTLDRCAARLGLTPERAKEIEAIANK